MARQTKFNRAIAEKIVRLIERGNTGEAAAVACGLGRRTFYRWLVNGANDGREWARFRKFAEAVARARATCEVRCVAVVRKAAMKDAKHAEWMLERRNPQQWGRATRIDLAGSVRADVSSNTADEHPVDLSMLTYEELDAIVYGVSKANGIEPEAREIIAPGVTKPVPTDEAIAGALAKYFTVTAGAAQLRPVD